MTAPARPYHHGSLRTALLLAGERALAAGGELSLRELAREVGVSHAAPRRHFADKQALLDALAADGFERLGESMRAAVGNGRRSFERRLNDLARAYVAFATEHSALLELMYAGKHRPGADELRAAADRAFAAPLELVIEAQEAGAIAPGDPAQVAICAWAAIHGLASLTAGGMLPSDMVDDAIDATIALIVRGLRG